MSGGGWAPVLEPTATPSTGTWTEARNAGKLVGMMLDPADAAVVVEAVNADLRVRQYGTAIMGSHDPGGSPYPELLAIYRRSTGTLRRCWQPSCAGCVDSWTRPCERWRGSSVADYPWQAPTSADLDVLNQSAAILAQRGPDGIPPELAGPMRTLFERTAWMGSLDVGCLSRVPCDEVIALARAVANTGKIDGKGEGSG